jgi:DNA polymerase III alpha subunit
MPEKYQNFDIETWVAEQCDTNTKMERAQQELVLFRQHNMITLLKYLKYLVDTMREHGIVWGVGRGSSVASYVLYLIGVHKVDSIKYQLDINEFLK